MSASKAAPSYKIEYRFGLPEDRELTFKIRLDPGNLQLRHKPAKELPDWTRLEYEQCSHCPLAPAEHPHCPVAVSLAQPAKAFDGIISHTPARITVKTPERSMGRKATVQEGLSGMMGLLMSTSGCPHTRFFRPMARFHLPFATTEETLYRVSTMYLFGQLMRSQQGLPADWSLEGLKPIYENLRILNSAMAKRLAGAGDNEGALNAVVILDQFAATFAYSLDDPLTLFAGLFESYLSSQGQHLDDKTSD